MASSIENAFGFGIATLTTEHFISAGMSSPWSVAKFASTDQDAAQVWQLFGEALAASLITSAIIGWILRDWSVFLWGVVGTAMVGAFVGSEYYRALQGTL